MRKKEDEAIQIISSGSTMKSVQRTCGLLMAALYGVSASFQFNDPDWYFWIPLYTTACAINLGKPNSRIKRIMAKLALYLGLFLFVKVSIEGLLLTEGTRGFWSLDMRERIVREKLGSGLVIGSMILCLENQSRKNYSANLTKYGMPVLVGIGYGLSFLFFAFQHHEMRLIDDVI